MERGPLARETQILSGTAGHSHDGVAPEGVTREVARIAALFGDAIRSERRRRRVTLRTLAAVTGLGRATIADVEAGRPATLATYVRVAGALRLRPELRLVDPRRRDGAADRQVDVVHAAMGEAQAAHLLALGYQVRIDEPYQHYQFAGRADVVAWSIERAALLHIENRTGFPDLQDAFGAFNAKRRYLGSEIAAQVGVDRWRSETHVIAALWSTEALLPIRTHAASFAAVCPDPPGNWSAWWCGQPPSPGRHATIIAFDPIAGTRSDRRRWLTLEEIRVGARARHRDYTAAAAAIRGGR